MNVSLPAALKEYVDEQAAEGGYGSRSEYVRELIRKDQYRTRLRRVLTVGAESPPARVADVGYFDELRRLATKDTM